MIRWFGDSWGAAACDPKTWEPTPTGVFCHCDEPIAVGDRGVLVPSSYRPYAAGGSSVVGMPWHLGCWLAHIVGHIGAWAVMKRQPEKYATELARLDRLYRYTGDVGPDSSGGRATHS